jgi:hypothetical protein
MHTVCKYDRCTTTRFFFGGEGGMAGKSRSKKRGELSPPRLSGFDEHGRPGGGGWLQIEQVAEMFSVGCEAVRKWRTDPRFPDDAEHHSGGRVWLNPIRILWWRLDRLRERRGMTAAEAVAALRPSFRGWPVDDDGELMGWFV